MLGGLARRAAFVEKSRTEGVPVLVVDSGDLFFSREKVDSEKALAKARVIGQAYRRMATVAVNVGDLDLIQGLDFLQKEASQGLPLISANLLSSTSKTPLFPAYVIQKVSGIKIAFFGLLSPNLDPEIRGKLGERIVIRDPIEAARETVLKLRNRADLIVLLSDLGTYRDRELVKAIPGIHFVLGGHEGRGLMQPDQEGKTFLVQSYAKGMYVGRLRLTIEDSSLPFRDKAKVGRLQEQIRNLDSRLVSLQKTKEEHPNYNVAPTIQRINQAKGHLQEELQRSLAESNSKRNGLLWDVVTLNSSLPEEKEIQGWIREAGIDKD